MSTFLPINISSLITANHSAPCPYLCAKFYGYISLADKTVAFYLQFGVNIRDMSKYLGLSANKYCV